MIELTCPKNDQPERPEMNQTKRFAMGLAEAVKHPEPTFEGTIFDGRNPANQLKVGRFIPIISKVLYISTG